MISNEMTLEFEGLEFEGFKLKKDFKNYPWKNKEDGSKYLDNLFEEGGEYNMIRYKKLTMMDYVERIHIALSYMMIFRIVSFIFLGITGIFGFLNMIIPGIIALIISISFLILHKYFNTKAEDLFKSKDEVGAMIEFVFDNK